MTASYLYVATQAELGGLRANGSNLACEMCETKSTKCEVVCCIHWTRMITKLETCPLPPHLGVPSRSTKAHLRASHRCFRIGKWNAVCQQSSARRRRMETAETRWFTVHDTERLSSQRANEISRSEEDQGSSREQFAQYACSDLSDPFICAMRRSPIPPACPSRPCTVLTRTGLPLTPS